MDRSSFDALRRGEGSIADGLRAARRGVAKARAVALNRSIPQYMTDVVTSVPRPARTPASTPAVRSPRRIAAFSTYPIHPRRGGGQLRGWYLADGLGRREDTEVTIVSLTTNPDLAGDHTLSDRVTEHCVLIDHGAARRETELRLVTGDVSITDIASGLMWPGISGFTEVATRALDQACAAIAVQPYLIDAIDTLASGIATVYDSHNDEVELKATILPRHTVGGRWLERWVDDLERRASEGSVLVTTTTEVDLRTLSARYRIDATTEVIPNGVDTGDIEFIVGTARVARRQLLDPHLGLERNRPVALFVGSGHLPNIEAGRHIVSLARQVPGVDFVLAGDHSTRLGLANLPPNVHAIGAVGDDLLELLLTSSTVALNPMGGGSGSNLKLFTYLAAGLPVLSTTVGTRGIDPEAAGVMTTSVGSLAAGLDALLSEDGNERVLAGRNYVEANCDWRVIADRFAALVVESTPS